MHVRVRFRYRTDTGEVEVFTVEDIADGPRAADHDALHDAATVDVARVVDANPRLSEIVAAESAPPRTERPASNEEPPTTEDPTASRSAERQRD